jgi:peptidoglycan/LPS O-acetylase OafA/YrhL
MGTVTSPSSPVDLSRAGRVEGIDILRGICIVAVVLHHINLRIPFKDSYLGKHLSREILNVLFWSGYYGVRVFFVISGFLIASWSLKRWGNLSSLSLKKFYVIRFARIMPCLIALLILLSALHLAGVPGFLVRHTSLGRALLAALTFHVNWLEARVGYLNAPWDPLWSLSVEEMFYVFFPLLCVFTRKQIFLVPILIGFIVAGPSARVLIQNNIWVDYSYLSCMDGIALGCLAAMISARFKFSARAALGWEFSGALLFLLIFVFRRLANASLYKAGLDVTVLNVGVALLIIGLQQRFDHGMNPARWWSAFLRWFGRNSYEVYLTHMLVVWPAITIFRSTNQPIDRAPIWFLGIAGVTGVVGYVVARFYSEPMNRALRSKLQKSAKAAGA